MVDSINYILIDYSHTMGILKHLIQNKFQYFHFFQISWILHVTILNKEWIIIN